MSKRESIMKEESEEGS